MGIKKFPTGKVLAPAMFLVFWTFFLVQILLPSWLHLHLVREIFHLPYDLAYAIIFYFCFHSTYADFKEKLVLYPRDQQSNNL